MPPRNPELLRAVLHDVTAGLRRQREAYLYWAAGIVLIGLTIFVVANKVTSPTSFGPVFNLGATLVAAAAAFPMNTYFSTTRKLTILEHYVLALRREPPPEDVLEAVAKFIEDQLKG